MTNINNNDMPKEFNMVKLSMSFDKSLHSDFVVDSLEKAIYLINDYLSDSPHEVMIGIALDTKRKPISCSVLGAGNESGIGDIKSNIFRFALLSCADSVVLIHNHPRSSKLELSNGDLQEIANIQQVATMLGIKFRDFIVVGNEKLNRAYYSWWEKRVITQYDFLNSLPNLNITDETLSHTDPARTDLLNNKSAYNDPSSDINEEISSHNDSRNKGLFGLFK